MKKSGHEHFTKKHQHHEGNSTTTMITNKNIDTIRMACPWPFQAYVFFTTIDALIPFYIPKSFVVLGINTPSLTLTSIILQGNFI
jgi:hypothetical protein